MKKEIVKKQIFEKYYDGYVTGVPFSDLPKDLLPDDIIDIHKEDAYYSSDSSSEAQSYLRVFRDLLETDAEFEKRKSFWEKKFAESKKARHEQYLKLKK